MPSSDHALYHADVYWQICFEINLANLYRAWRFLGREIAASGLRFQGSYMLAGTLSLPQPVSLGNLKLIVLRLQQGFPELRLW